MVVEIVTFSAAHLPGVLRLCEAEGWPSLPSDPVRAARVLSAPGAVTVVAVAANAVVGFAFALVDAGSIDGYLTTLAVDAGHRRQGIAGNLVQAVFATSGASRLDVLSEPGSEHFYESLPNREFRGFRIYPR
jgi:ribosomal protein S18 acetylase RimI-like enzyme